MSTTLDDLKAQYPEYRLRIDTMDKRGCDLDEIEACLMDLAASDDEE